MGNASFFCMQISETSCPQANPPETEPIVPPASAVRVYLPTWQAQPDTGTAAVEVIRRGRNSWKLQPMQLGPNNRYGRAGEHGDGTHWARAVAGGGASRQQRRWGAKFVRIAPYHAEFKEGAQFVRNAPYHDGCN